MMLAKNKLLKIIDHLGMIKCSYNLLSAQQVLIHCILLGENQVP